MVVKFWAFGEISNERMLIVWELKKYFMEYNEKKKYLYN